MNENLKLLCRNIKLLRAFHCLSQEDVAGAINIARSTYSTYESGSKNIDLQTIDSLARLYNISFDSLANHDLSRGIFHRIYFDHDRNSLKSLLNNYQSLSIISRNLVEERLDVLLEREGIFYDEYCHEAPEENETNKKSLQSERTAGKP